MNYSVIAGIAAFPCMWCIGLLLESRISGWAQLAVHYRADDRVGGGEYLCLGKVGVISYEMPLTLHISEVGLGMSVPLPFRIGHPPLFIPWVDIHDVCEKRKMFVFPILSLTIGRPAIAGVTLRFWPRDKMPTSINSKTSDFL